MCPPNRGNGLIAKKQLQLDEILSVQGMLIIPSFRNIPARLTASVRMGPTAPQEASGAAPVGDAMSTQDQHGLMSQCAPSCPEWCLPPGSLPGPLCSPS